MLQQRISRGGQVEDRFGSHGRIGEQQRAFVKDHEKLLAEAKTYLHLFHHERGMFGTCAERLMQIQDQVEQIGLYWHTYDELAYGAQVAWRNSTRCIGRLHWKSLVVRDMRHCR